MSGILSSFQINEKVAFLNEAGGGVVRRIDESGFIYVEDETGFERPFRLNQLVRIHGERYQLSEEDFKKLQEKESNVVRKLTLQENKTTNKANTQILWEIDLHIESLLESHFGMSNQEILTHQLKEFRNFINQAKTNHVKKLVVIHGVGEGVLKEEVLAILRKDEDVSYKDADYMFYGKGATEITVRY